MNPSSRKIVLPGKVKDEEEIRGMKASIKRWDLRETRIEVEKEEAKFSWVLMNEHSKFYHTKRLILNALFQINARWVEFFVFIKKEKRTEILKTETETFFNFKKTLVSPSFVVFEIESVKVVRIWRGMRFCEKWKCCLAWDPFINGIIRFKSWRWSFCYGTSFFLPKKMARVFELHSYLFFHVTIIITNF